MANKVILIGKLPAQQNVINGNSGIMLSFGVEMDDGWWNPQANQWNKKMVTHNVLAKAKLAERNKDRLQQNSIVYIEGKLAYGNNGSYVEATKIEILAGWVNPNDNGQNNNNQNQNNNQGSNQNQGGADFDDDIPF